MTGGTRGDESVAPGLLVEKLARSPVLSRCTRQEIARLVPFLRSRQLQPGEALSVAGQPAHDLWLLVRGSVRVTRQDGSFHEVSDGLVGEEAALGIGCYLADIVASGQATVAAMARDVLPASLTDQSPRAQAFGRSLIGAFAPSPFSDAPVAEERDGSAPGALAYRMAGWIAATIAPLLLLWLLAGSALRWEQRQLSAVLVSTAMLWIFGSVPPFVAGLLVVLPCVTLGLVPTGVALSGFASNAFFLALSAFSIGTVLIESGAIDRVFRLLMKHCPPAAVYYDFAAFFAGFLLTPIVPSAVERARVLAPLAAETSATLGYDPGGRENTSLMLSIWTGLAAFSPMFLTGGPLNLMLYGSLPEQVEDAFPALRWAADASVALLILVAVFLAAHRFLGVRAGAPGGPRPTIDAQLGFLGPLTVREWLAAGGVVLFLSAVATVSFHKIDHRLLALTVVCGYLVLGTLGKHELNLRIDWSALILLGTLIGVTVTIMQVGLHAVIAEQMPWLSDVMRYRPRLFVAILALVVVLAGFCTTQAGALLAVVAVPLAVQNGINPWVVIFVILLMSDIWVWPSQSEPYRVFRWLVRRDRSLDEATFLQFNAVMSAARVVALAASVIYWEHLRML
jgi:DASS family divalent anion:Na+ symporter